MTMATPEQIADEAASWVGTPFHHQGRAKGLGVDCIGLIVGVCKNLNLDSGNVDAVTGQNVRLHEYDVSNYSALPNKTQLSETLAKFCVLAESANPQLGDIILFTMQRWPQHVGVVTRIEAEGIHFAHASQPVGKVIISRYDDTWKRRAAGHFRFPAAAFNEGEI